KINSSFNISNKIAAGILCINPEDNILAVSRGRGSNLWGMPGGKQEPGETLEECAIRETFEETGLVATIRAPLLTAQSVDGYWFTTFLADVSGIIKSSDE